jgi:hypothetical protein
MKKKQRVPAPRGGQSDDLAAYEVGCGRISLRCASMTRKLAPNIPGIRGMSFEAAPQRKIRRAYSLCGALGLRSPAAAILVAMSLLAVPLSAAARGGLDQPAEQAKSKSQPKPGKSDSKPADKSDNEPRDKFGWRAP